MHKKKFKEGFEKMTFAIIQLQYKIPVDFLVLYTNFDAYVWIKYSIFKEQKPK